MSLGLAVLFLGFLYLTVVSKAFRLVALAGLGILVLGGLLFFSWLEDHDAEARRKSELAETLIPTAEVELSDPRVTFSSSDGSPSRIEGRIRNNSRYTMGSLKVVLTFQDCPSKATKKFVACETVGDETEEIEITVPPGQSRDFNKTICGPILSPRGKIEWNYKVLSTWARMD